MKISMKKLLKRILKEQGGQILPLVLVMLVIGSTIVAGSLAYAATTVRVGHDSLAKQEQYYAAEAGAKDSVWRFKHDYYTTKANVSLSQWTYNPSPVNGQDMEVTAAFVSSGIYKIVSEAYKDGFSTTVEYYLSGVSVFFTHPATAAGDITCLAQGTLIPDDPLEGYDHFPTPASLRTYYLNPPHPALTHVAGGTINTTGGISEGNIYYEGSLSIKGNGKLTLTGNIFVAGDLNIEPTGNNIPEIDLNGYTIYVTGSMEKQKKAQWDGPGCIIVEGPISLWPSGNFGDYNEFIFIMSVTGNASIWPAANGGHVYGSVAAGGGDVYNGDITNKTIIEHTDLPLGGLDFPDDPDTYEWSVSNWKVDRELVLFIISRVLAPGEVGVSYSSTLIAKNGVPPYTWSVTGSLPADLNLEPSTGVISGIPSSATVFPSPVFTVTVTDANGSTATQDLTIAIHPNVEIPVQTLPDGTVGSDYYYELDVDGGIGPYTWSLTSEGFPALSDWANPVDLANGIISGTPTAAGTYQFSIKVKDGLNAEHGPVILQVTIN